MSSRLGRNVSRETYARFEVYTELLRKWNPRINLVSKSTLDDLWARHIADSAQLHAMAPPSVRHWADLGSGGGFPGLVIAILAMETDTPARVTLVESDTRKSAFLRTVIRETGAPATVETARIEDLTPLGCDVISARALADLSTLLGYAARHMSPEGVALFPKGIGWKKEIAAAQEKWKFRHHVGRSETEDGPVVLSISGVLRV